jgi:hydrogenase maturation protease
MSRPILILGVGNSLMSDDGVGIHAARALASAPPTGTLVVDAGTDVLSTLAFLEEAERAIVIDALRAGGAPGNVRLFRESELAPAAGATTAHAVNLLASRHLLPPGAAWPELLVIGVEPAVLDYGLQLSPAVAEALPLIERRCREAVAVWQNTKSTP